jgi:hypothetical protein
VPPLGDRRPGDRHQLPPLVRDRGLRVRGLEDLSDCVGPNWERGYEVALRALAEPVRLGELLRVAAAAVQHGAAAVQAA